MEIELRKAVKEDLPEVLDLIKELAEFEKQPQEVTITLPQLEADGFGTHPLYWIILATHQQQIVGMSFYYIRYSTWKGRCLYLEDLVVKEAFKQQGIGSQLFEATIAEAKKMGAKLMTWQVLDWNEPAIQFYKKYQAELDDEWLNGKIRF